MGAIVRRIWEILRARSGFREDGDILRDDGDDNKRRCAMLDLARFALLMPF